jgi:hypothetical protein
MAGQLVEDLRFGKITHATASVAGASAGAGVTISFAPIWAVPATDLKA